MSEALSFRLPDGTRTRIAKLARAGESQAAVIVRALACLERNTGCDTDAIQPEPDRLAEIERRLAALEAAVVQAAIQRTTPEATTGTVAEPQGDEPVSQDALQRTTPDREAVVERIKALRGEGVTASAIARQLNADGEPSPSGKGRWHGGTVQRLLARGG